GDTYVSDDELEEIVSVSDSDADTDNYKDDSDDEVEDSDGGEDDLKAMQEKQGSQYWKKLRDHMVERDATWDCDEGQMSNAWKRLEKKYLNTKRVETQSGGKAIKKKPWWDYVYHLKKHSAKAKAHALDGGGAANVDVPSNATVPGTNVGENSAPPSQGHIVPMILYFTDKHKDNTKAALLPYVPTPTPTDAVVAPPPKRRRIDEIATMAAAKLVSDAINSSNAMALRQPQDSTHLLVAAMNMAGLRQQMASPPIPPAAPATTPPPSPPADASDANMAGSEDVAEQHEP
ncbi:unnamed protein product, partial [Closterium sp. NIES-54]